MNSNKGFTLLELTMVMCVMAILASIAAPNYIHYRLQKMNNLAYEEANQFFIKAIDHFADVGGNKTVYPITLDFPYYVLDCNIISEGSLTDTGGVISSADPLEFRYQHSSTHYEVSALGVITKVVK